MKWMGKTAVFASVAVIAVVGFLIITKTYYYFPQDDDPFYLFIDSKNARFVTDEKFLSVALDTSFMKCLFHKLNSSAWKRLEELSSLLSPGYLRLGGTLADQVIFSVETNDYEGEWSHTNESCTERYSLNESLIITGNDWIKINNFAINSKLNFLIDLNVLLRNKNEWNSTNVESLLKFSEKKGFSLDFQLGNEPNSFGHVFNVTISGKQLGQDFDKLKNLLGYTLKYRSSKLIGPDVTRPKNLEEPSLNYLKDFLSNTDSVDAVSWHQYYLNGRTAVLEDFINPATFNELQKEIISVSRVVRKFSPNLPIWLGETGSAYGGGAPHLSDRFVATFLWIDKLGVCAQSGISVVIRQSLFKENYALIDSELNPTPDFWISFFYKNVVGNKVLRLRGKTRSINAKFLRFYSHCVSSKFVNVLGKVIVFAINMSNENEKAVITGMKVSYPIYTFTFTSDNSSLTSKSVALNGKKLEYNGQSIYDLLDKAIEVKLPLIIPAFSINFWIFQNVSDTICT